MASSSAAEISNDERTGWLGGPAGDLAATTEYVDEGKVLSLFVCMYLAYDTTLAHVNDDDYSRRCL